MFRNYRYSGGTYDVFGYFSASNANSTLANQIRFNRTDWNTVAGNQTSYDALVSYVTSGETVTMRVSGTSVDTTYLITSLTGTSGSTLYYTAGLTFQSGSGTLSNGTNYDLYFNLDVNRQFSGCCAPYEIYYGSYTGQTSGVGGSINYLNTGATVLNNFSGGTSSCAQVIPYSGTGAFYEIEGVVQYSSCAACVAETPCTAVYQMSACCSPYEVFVLNNVPGVLTTGETYFVSASTFNGCAQVVTYSGVGSNYSTLDIVGPYTSCTECILTNPC